MTYQSFKSNLNSNFQSRLHQYQNRHSYIKTYTVTVYGEDGETEDFEVSATSEKEAINKAYSYTSIVNIQYAFVYE